MTLLIWIYIILGFVAVIASNKFKNANGYILAMICFAWALFLNIINQ